MRYNSIQFLRCVAVLMVLALHSHLAVSQPVAMIPFLSDFGWLGVRLFFVISGFIIAERIGASPSFARYAVRRYLRVFPLYFLMTVAAICLRAGFGVGAFTSSKTDSGAVFSPASPDYLVKSLLMLPQDEWPILMVGWSLEYEVVFYLFFGAAYFLVGRMGALIVMAALTVLGLFFADLTRPVLDGFFVYFLAGVLAREVLSRRIAPVIAAAPWAFGAATVVCTLILYRVAIFPGFVFLCLNALSFAALLIWCANAEGGGRAFQAPDILTRLGDMSFSIYLTHWFVIAIVRDLTTGVTFDQPTAELIRVGVVPLSLGASWLVWRLVETPLHNGVGRALRSA